MASSQFKTFSRVQRRVPSRNVQARGSARNVANTAACIAAATALTTGAPALAELNKMEAAAGGEFGMGTAQQYGEATVTNHDFSGQVQSTAHQQHLHM